MARHRGLRSLLVFLAGIVGLVSCNAGPSGSGTFDRNYNVTGPIRLEITNASGDVAITGSSARRGHACADRRASRFGFGNPQKRLDGPAANPHTAQTGDPIRTG